MGKNKEYVNIGWDEELESITPVKKENIETEMFGDIKEEKTKLLIIRIPTFANLRLYPHHMSKLIKRLRKDTEYEVKEIHEGSLVQLTNIWYEVDGGFVHASQVEVL